MKNELDEEDFYSGMDNLFVIEEVTTGRIFISKSVIQIPLHLKDTSKFTELIAKKDTQEYTATYSVIDEVYSSEEQSEVEKELVIEFRKNHPEGYSVANEKIGKEIVCQQCGAICAVGLINPKTQLCTDCDKEYEPAEWWWIDWKSRK